jgi:hypothetical protein
MDTLVGTLVDRLVGTLVGSLVDTLVAAVLSPLQDECGDKHYNPDIPEDSGMVGYMVVVAVVELELDDVEVVVLAV